MEYNTAKWISCISITIITIVFTHNPIFGLITALGFIQMTKKKENKEDNETPNEGV